MRYCSAGTDRRIASPESHLIFSGRASTSDAYRQPGRRRVRSNRGARSGPSTRPYRAKCCLKLATDRPTETVRTAVGSQMSSLRPLFIRQSFHQDILRQLTTDNTATPLYRPSTVVEPASLKQKNAVRPSFCLNDSGSAHNNISS